MDLDPDPSSSLLSSPKTVVTAIHDDSPATKSTAASSPALDRPCRYREVRALRRVLKNHVQIFLEEQLYDSAIDLLNSILSSGISRPPPHCRPLAIPPPSHLALLNTLIVHPVHTTRCEIPESVEVSAKALQYLRNVLAIVGPINADFRTAFQFRSPPRAGRRFHAAAASNNNSDISDDESDDEDKLRGRISHEGSLWCRGQDLWSTVGWAFSTCSLYPHRWRYWRNWLEFMIEVLEEDWKERDRRDHEAHRANGGDEDDEAAVPKASRQESLILMYMAQSDGRPHNFKTMLRALFADGRDVSSSTFREVFEKEPRGLKKESKKRRDDMILDLESGQFGDYFDDESISSGVSEPPTPQKPKDARESASGPPFSQGLVESIEIRQRFFRLLSEVTYILAKRNKLNELYEEYAAAIKVLPLQAFALFVNSNDESLLLEARITLARELFHLLLPSSYKNPAKVDPEGDAMGCLTTLMLEHCYIGHAANTVAMEDNAKLSLLVESSIQLLWRCEMLDYSDGLVAAAEKGIRARESKAKKRRTGKMRSERNDTLALDVMNQSAERIMLLLECLAEAEGGDDDDDEGDAMEEDE